MLALLLALVKMQFPIYLQPLRAIDDILSEQIANESTWLNCISVVLVVFKLCCK